MLLLIVRGPIVHTPLDLRIMPRSTGDDIARRFGQRLRERRIALGLSQEAFAQAAGLDRTYISGIERGKRNVSLRNIEILAQTLGTSISELTESL